VGYRVKRIKALEEPIKKEITDKVKKKQWGTVYRADKGGNLTLLSPTTTIGVQEGTTDNTKKKESINAGKGNTKYNRYDPGYDDDDDYYKDVDLIHSKKDVYRWLTNDCLVDVAQCDHASEVKDVLQLYGYLKFFTDSDIDMILKVAKEFINDKIN
jgi:hypothetical protein